MNLPNGHYQSCESCRKYVTCSNENMYDRDCPGVLVWDDVAKQCLYTSTTCNIQTPLSSETFRMKRAVDQNMKHSSIVGQFQGYNWTILISSAVGGVAIVALVAVAIKLIMKKN
ncbi:uncharacterized protein LOC134269637 [Saccostrea cucullata]|uniref:uncharacterized protein LOC134269637 n=1 Tax=Saccostrea cuccullata TaxID=36930 RepID=UPI002ED0737A